MVIRRVTHHERLKIHVKALAPEERGKVRHIHIDSITPGIPESLKQLPHLMLVTHEPGIAQDQTVVGEIRKMGISVIPVGTPKKPRQGKYRKPDWYAEMIY